MNNHMVEKVAALLVLVVFGGMVWAVVTMRSDPTPVAQGIVPTTQPTPSPTPRRNGVEEEGDFNLNTPTPTKAKTTVTPTQQATPTVSATPSVTTTPATTPAASLTVTPTPLVDAVEEYVIHGFEYAYDPSVLQVKAGTAIKVQFTNTGEMTHDFVIKELEVSSGPIEPGESTTIEFVVPVNGLSEYNYFCSIGNHRQLGMEGRIVVSQ